MSTKRGGGAVSLCELMKKKSSRKNSSDEASTPAEAIGRSHSQQGSEGDVEHAVEAIATVQSELNSLEISQTQALTEILKKYKELKKPVYSRRQEAIKQVPEFWFKVLLAHPAIGEHISDPDQGALRHLTAVEVVDVTEERLDGAREEESEGGQEQGGGRILPDYRVNFYFSPNVYFENSVLWKEFRFRNDEATVSASEVLWKDTQESKGLQETLVPHLLAQDPVPENVQPSFFSIFHAEDRDLEMGDVLKEEVWRDPVGIYLSVDFQEEGEEGEEDGRTGRG